MSLSCKCDYGDGDYDWYYIEPNDYEVLATKRARRCSSCKDPVPVGSTCSHFDIYRPPNCDIEERIHGDEVYQAPMWHCERCSDLYFSLNDLGFTCIQPDESMLDLAKEYAATYGSGKAG